MRLSPLIGKPVTRFAQLLVTTSLWLAPPGLGHTQPAPPPGAGPGGGDVAGQPNTDPPPVAGSLANLAGQVSFHAAGETQWSPATLNYPVTNGEGFWTEPQSSATIDVADNRVVLDESTEFDVAKLDLSQFVATQAQGAIFVQLNTLTQGQTLVVNTPRGSVQISQPGQYEIVAGDTNDATTITVVQGAAHISGTNIALDVGPNQSAAITGSGTLQGTVGSILEDAFLKTQLQLLAQHSQQHSPVPQVCQYMTGGEQLASYGTFTETPQYGQVWYPQDVPSNWAPYRDGHWAYVSPWGWTWVDNARWGFAPFHYGRWAQIDGRWGWIPGGGAAYVPGTYPIYSPALVSFVGVGIAGLGFSLGVGEGGYAPAWIPLGPHEPYYPWYHVREGYFARINSFYGVPRDIINRGPTYINTINIHQNNFFMNHAAATVISPAAFARGQSVLAAGHPLPERAFAEARPLGGRLAVRPTAFTPNLPAEAAHHFNVPLPAHPVQVAAGPRIVAAAGARAIPELRRASLPQNIHGVPAIAHPVGPAGMHPALGQPRPSEIARPGESVVRPGLPALRSVAGSRPGEPAARPGEAGHAGEPGARAPAEIARPVVPSVRLEVREQEAKRPEQPQHEAVGRPGKEPRPNAVPRTETRSPPHPEAHAVPQHEAAPHVARPEAPRPEMPRPEAHETARQEARPIARPETRPGPRMEAPRPEARQPAAPRPAPRPEGHPEEKKGPHH